MANEERRLEEIRDNLSISQSEIIDKLEQLKLLTAASNPAMDKKDWMAQFQQNVNRSNGILKNWNMLFGSNNHALQQSTQNLNHFNHTLQTSTTNFSKSINGLVNLLSGNLQGAFSSLINSLGKYGRIVESGLKIANFAFEAQARNNRLTAQIGAGYNNPQAALQFRGALYGFTNLSNENVQNYANYISENFNTVGNPQLAIQRARMRAEFGNYFQGRVSQGTTDTLLSNALRRGQISNLGTAGQLAQYIEQGALRSNVSQERFTRNINAVNDAVAQYEVDIEKVGGLMTKFGKEVDKGTISLQQLTAVQSSIAGGSTEQNAGLAALLMQSGRLPSDALKYAGSPLGLAGWLRRNAFRSDVIKGVEGQVRNEAYSIGLNNPLERSEYFRMRYQSLGYNISNKQAEILGQGGSLSAQDWKTIQAQGEKAEQARRDLQAKALDFYNEATTPGGKISDIYNLLSQHFASREMTNFEQSTLRFDKEGNVLTSSEESVGGALGYFGTRAAQAIPVLGPLITALGMLNASLNDNTKAQEQATEDFIRQVRERNANAKPTGNGAATHALTGGN